MLFRSARHALSRAMHHWLPEAQADLASDPAKTVAVLRSQASRDVRREPNERGGFLLPYDVSLAEDFGLDLPIIPEEMV